MATFVWPQEVRWPPPANISANYDVVPPDVVAQWRRKQQEKTMPLAYIQFLDAQGRPIDPGYGVDESGGYHPDQGLPGGGGRPGHLPARPGRPIDPGFGNPGWGGGRPPVDPGYEWGGGQRPGHLPAWRPGERPGHPIAPGGRPVDPGFGWGGEVEGGEAGQLPIWPLGPEHGLPPIAGQPLPPIDPPPGTIWPPLPPSIPPGKTLVAVYISGVGSRYAVITVSPPHPDQGLPDVGEGEGGEGGEHPDQGLPARPGRPPQPGQGLPPNRPGRPVDPGFGNPGAGRPPGGPGTLPEPLPPGTPQPKR